MVSSRHRYPPHAQPPASPAVTKPLLAGCLMFAIVGLIFDFHGLRRWLSPSAIGQASQASQCKTIVQTEARLTREQLAELLTIPERDAKDRIRQVIAEPYCQLPAIHVRSGVSAEREAYPLAFDPDTQLVILYENDEYAGYRFSFE